MSDLVYSETYPRIGCSSKNKTSYRIGDGREPHRYSGATQDNGLQSDLLLSTGEQNIITFDGGQLED